MKYFEILNCKKDPFPGQPSPELFFPAAPCEACLNTLFTAVQSGRHAFHTVTGDTGTGKTTLSFQLHKKLSSEINDAQLVLASETWFSSKKIFLKKIAETLSIAEEDNQDDETLFKKTRTFLSKAPQKGKPKVILLIDQAEQIPSYCLELLEELFSDKINPANIQFVLFAGTIFTNKISLYFNLSQNLNNIHFPPKLSFSDAKSLLSYYLTESGSSFSLNSLVTRCGQYSLYFFSGGNPGNILDLFRLTLTNQIIQDRAKAGSILCYQSAKEVFPDKVQKYVKTKFAALATTSILLLVLITTAGQQQESPQASLPGQATIVTTTEVVPETPSPGSQIQNETAGQESSPEISPQKHVVDILQSLQEESEKEKTADSLQQPITEDKAEVALAKIKAPQEAKATSTKQPSKEKISKALPTILPENLGSITVFEEETLGDMIRRIYGPFSFTPENTERILSNNKHIAKKHFLNVGDKITFPTMGVSLSTSAEKNLWIHLVSIEKLQDAYRYLRIYSKKDAPLLMIPSWSEKEAFRFNIVLEEDFTTQKAAESKLSQLSKELFPTASILEGLDPKMYAFSIKKPAVEKKTKTATARPKAPKSQKLPIVASTKEKVTSLNTVTKPVSPEITPSKILEITPDQQKTQSMLGTLPIPKKSTIGHLIRAVYGKNSVNNANISWLLKKNPHIKNANNIMPGTLLHFPVKAVQLKKNSPSAWWVSLGTFDTLLDANNFLFKNTPAKPWLLIIPTKEKPSRKFTVLIEQFFQNEKLAQEKVSRLTDDGFKNMSLLQGLDSTHYSFEEKSK